MTQKDLPAALRTGWWLCALGLVVGGIVALVFTLVSTPLYTAHAQLFVSATNAASSQDVFQGGQFSQNRVTSYAEILSGEELAARVVDSLGLDTSPSDLTEQITASAAPDTVLLDVTVVDPSPERAQAIAAALGTEFADLVVELETPQFGSSSPVKVTMFDQPELPQNPSSPQPLRNVALGLVAGLLAGALVAVARARLDRSIKDPEVAADTVGAPVIGTIRRDQVLEQGAQHAVDRLGDSAIAEDYRRLRANLQFLNVDHPPKVIMISSAVPSEGKTTVVINLALAMAEAGRRVTIVEADLRRPRVTRYLGMVSGVGLTNVLAGSADLHEVLQRYGELTVLAAGPAPPNPGELLSSSQMSSLVEKLRPDNDFILVDAPPLLPVADATELAVMMDGVLLAVRYGGATGEQVQQAAATLERVGARALGVILNIVPPSAEIASAYGYLQGDAREEYGRAAATGRRLRGRLPSRQRGRRSDAKIPTPDPASA